MIATLGMCLGCNSNTSPNSDDDGKVVIYGTNGQVLTAKDLKDATGSFPFEIIGGKNVPVTAKRLHELGREAGGRGEYFKALELFDKAAALAPDWPYPVYDRAYTCMLMKDFAGAREHYGKTLKLSPRGFFTAITAMDTLEREHRGELPAGTYLSYVGLEGIADRNKKLFAVRQIIARAPQFAAAWKELSVLSEDEKEQLQAVEKALAIGPDAETKGILLVNKALRLEIQGDHDRAVKLLGQLALDPASTLATEQIAKFSLAHITQKK